MYLAVLDGDVKLFLGGRVHVHGRDLVGVVLGLCPEVITICSLTTMLFVVFGLFG